MSDWIHNGLNLSRPEESTPAEWEAWRAHEMANRGYPLPTWDLIGRLRPDVIKRWFVEQQSLRLVEDSFLTVLTHVHLYAVTGFPAGVMYSIEIAEKQGYARDDVIDTLAVAMLSSPSEGMHDVAAQIETRLARYRDPDVPFAWPDGWDRDRTALRSGADFSTPAVQSGDIDRIRGWYERVTGEVPRTVEFLARHNPQALKARRNRFEHVLRSLPNQMLPLLMITIEASAESEDGIRDALLLARGLGVTRPQAVAAICACMPRYLQAELALADRVAGDVLADW